MLPIAPTTEQNAIAHFLDDATVTVDDGIARAQREINLLHEYRTRLIADVVTGKLDVCARRQPRYLRSILSLEKTP